MSSYTHFSRNGEVSDFNVSIKSLLPQQQQKFARKLLRSADCYQQRFIKFPDIGIFHCYQELIHAVLLESNPNVSSFVPQPYQFQIGKNRYTPDCYYTYLGKRYVIEIKPQGKFRDDLRIPLEQYLATERMVFKVISNEEIMEHETKALSWLKILKVMMSSADVNTKKEEIYICQNLFDTRETEFGNLLFLGDRRGKYKHELAIFRLAHKGLIILDVNNDSLSYSTKVSLCT